MALYKLIKDRITGEVSSVLRNSDSKLKISIPFDVKNRDYQEYLKWVEAGNTAEAAD